MAPRRWGAGRERVGTGASVDRLAAETLACSRCGEGRVWDEGGAAREVHAAKGRAAGARPRDAP